MPGKHGWLRNLVVDGGTPTTAYTPGRAADTSLGASPSGRHKKWAAPNLAAPPGSYLLRWTQPLCVPKGYCSNLSAPVSGAPLRYIRLGLSSRIFPGSLSVRDRKDRGVFTERVSELCRTSEPKRRAPEGTCCYLLCAHGTRLLLPVALTLRLLLSLGVIPPYALRKPFADKFFAKMVRRTANKTAGQPRRPAHRELSRKNRYARSARSRARRAVSSQPRHGSVMDLPYTPPSIGWAPSSM